MNAPQQMGIEGDAETRMQEALQAQRDSYLQEGAVSAETRIDRIDRAIDVLVHDRDCHLVNLSDRRAGALR